MRLPGCEVLENLVHVLQCVGPGMQGSWACAERQGGVVGGVTGNTCFRGKVGLGHCLKPQSSMHSRLAREKCVCSCL